MRSTCRRTSSANAASERHSAYSRKSCWSVRWFTHGRVAAAAQIGQRTTTELGSPLGRVPMPWNWLRWQCCSSLGKCNRLILGVEDSMGRFERAVIHNAEEILLGVYQSQAHE